MKRLRRVALWSCALLLVSGSFQPCSLVVASGPPTTAATLPATEKQIVLGIEGMTCKGCAKNVESALSKLAGVKSVSVNFDERQAVIVAAASVTEESLAQAVEGAGYRVAGQDTPTPQESTGTAAAAEITVLQGTLAPLVEQFNKEARKPRVLALLSPT